MVNEFWDHPIVTIEKVLHIRRQIEALEASLKQLFGDGTQPLAKEKSTPAAKHGRKGKKSAAARARMAAAQKARWANRKGASPKPVKAARTRRIVSAESRKKMAAAQKMRWAKKKIDADVTMPNKLIW